MVSRIFGLIRHLQLELMKMTAMMFLTLSEIHVKLNIMAMATMMFSILLGICIFVKNSGAAIFDEWISDEVSAIAVPLAKSNCDSAVAFQSTDGQKNAHRQNHAARPDDVLKPSPLSFFSDDKADFEQNSEVDLFANHANFRQKFHCDSIQAS